jgi:hypothetical protein
MEDNKMDQRKLARQPDRENFRPKKLGENTGKAVQLRLFKG